MMRDNTRGGEVCVCERKHMSQRRALRRLRGPRCCLAAAAHCSCCLLLLLLMLLLLLLMLLLLMLLLLMPLLLLLACCGCGGRIRLCHNQQPSADAAVVNLSPAA